MTRAQHQAVDQIDFDVAGADDGPGRRGFKCCPPPT